MSVSKITRTAQEERVEALARLADSAGHDFSNLLTIMMMNLGFLEDTPGLSPECHRATRDALGAAKRAAKLSERLRAFSRKRDLMPKALDIREWLASVEETLRRGAGPGVEIRVGSSDDVWAAFADAKALHGALEHLIANATEAMPERGAKLLVQAANVVIERDAAGMASLSPGDYVLLTIRDNGRGMSKHTAEHAFEPFHSTKEPRTGHGLGLSIVDAFARQSGGFVELASGLGKGTTVKLYLPRAECPSGGGDAVSATRADTPTPGLPR